MKKTKNDAVVRLASLVHEARLLLSPSPSSIMRDWTARISEGRRADAVACSGA